jgi:hypothetical protein
MHPFPPISSVFSSNITLIAVLQQTQLTNGSPQSQQAILYIIYTMHFLTFHILTNKMD